MTERSAPPFYPAESTASKETTPPVSALEPLSTPRAHIAPQSYINNPIHSVVCGTGHYVPERVVSNNDLKSVFGLDTDDQWIKQRTGICQRHIAAQDELTSDIAIRAAQHAAQNSSVHISDIDAVILATATPDLTFPATATIVQNALGIKRGFAFDLQAVCAGFVYALANAHALLVSGQATCALVIGADTFSRIMDWTDRKTSVLFGDGAGAVIIKAVQSQNNPTGRGLLSSDLQSDGQFRDLLYVDGGVSKTQMAGCLRMQGPALFREAIEKLSTTLDTSLKKAGLQRTDIDWLVPHQANLRIIRTTAEKLELPMEKVVITIQDHANTSAASIPIALSTAVQAGKIKPEHIVATHAIGGGLAWGSLIWRW